MKVEVACPGMWVNVMNLNGGCQVMSGSQGEHPTLGWIHQGAASSSTRETVFVSTSGRGSPLRDGFIFIGLSHICTHMLAHANLFIYVEKYNCYLDKNPHIPVLCRQVHMGSQTLVQRLLGNQGIKTKSFRWIKFIFIVGKCLTPEPLILGPSHPFLRPGFW